MGVPVYGAANAIQAVLVMSKGLKYVARVGAREISWMLDLD